MEFSLLLTDSFRVFLTTITQSRALLHNAKKQKKDLISAASVLCPACRQVRHEQITEKQTGTVELPAISQFLASAIEEYSGASVFA